MSVDLNIDTRSIDITMAHLQEKLKKDTYVEMPWGYEMKDEDQPQAYCLK